MSEFEAICKRVASMPPSLLRSDALDLVGALRAQALLVAKMAEAAQMAQNESAVLRQELAAATARAETAEEKLADMPMEELRTIVEIAVLAGLGEGPLQNNIRRAAYWLARQNEVQNG